MKETPFVKKENIGAFITCAKENTFIDTFSIEQILKKQLLISW